MTYENIKGGTVSSKMPLIFGTVSSELPIFSEQKVPINIYIIDNI